MVLTTLTDTTTTLASHLRDAGSLPSTASTTSTTRN
jgi:hypothetical protein